MARVTRAKYPLTALRAFEVAARRGSFSDAADELNVTKSAVSRQIAELEEIIGADVFDRHVHRVELNPLGRQLFETLGPAFDNIGEVLGSVLDQVEHGTVTSRITIRVPTTFATRLLIRRLPNFESLHPGIEPNLSISAMVAQRDRSPWDVEVIYAKKPYPDGYELIFEERAVMVCAPTYLTSMDLRVPLPLDQLLLGRVVAGTPDQWDLKAWCDWAGIQWPVSPSLRQVPTDELAIEAALTGSGVALVESRFVPDELADGRLRLACDCGPFNVGAYMGRALPGKSEASGRLFLDWLKQAVVSLARQVDVVVEETRERWWETGP